MKKLTIMIGLICLTGCQINRQSVASTSPKIRFIDKQCEPMPEVVLPKVEVPYKHSTHGHRENCASCHKNS